MAGGADHSWCCSSREEPPLLERLQEAAHAEALVLRHQWREGDVVVWDNIATQHYAEAGYFPHRRRVLHASRVGSQPLAFPDGAAA